MIAYKVKKIDGKWFVVDEVGNKVFGPYSSEDEANRIRLWNAPMKEAYKHFGAELQLMARKKTPMSLNVGAGGGYLVPEELQLHIQQSLAEYSIFGMWGDNKSMLSAMLHVPVIDITASHAAGDSPLLGGLALGYIVDGSLIPESEPSFADNQMVVRQIGAAIYVSNQLVADGGEPLAAFIVGLAARSLAWKVDKDAISGPGGAKLLGIRNSDAVVTRARGISGHIIQSDIAGMVSQLIPACYPNAIWIASPTAMGDITSMPTYGSSNVTPGPGGLCGSLNGRPLFTTEKTAQLGTSGDIMLVDPTMYCVATRNIEIALSAEYPGAYFNNKSVYRVLWQGDGQPLVRGTATLADGSTAGAFVQLN